MFLYHIPENKLSVIVANMLIEINAGTSTSARGFQGGTIQGVDIAVSEERASVCHDESGEDDGKERHRMIHIVICRNCRGIDAASDG
jgi:hypothetical protein